jgi:myb proto-oncogene protein
MIKIDFSFKINNLKIIPGTAQVKDIKPGVLSKIFIIAEKEANGETHDQNMKKLISTCKNLQEYLLNYANYKPTKRD